MKTALIRNCLLSMKQFKKPHLPCKYCEVCNKKFDWRKKWERDWEQVKYCSNRCRLFKSGRTLLRGNKE